VRPPRPSAGGPGEGGPPQAGGKPGVPPAGPDTGSQQPPEQEGASGSYLTINKALKSMLDKLENSKQKPLVSMTVGMQVAPNFIAKNANQMPLLRVFKLLEEKWKNASVAGAALTCLRTDKVAISIGIDCRSDQQARDLDSEGRDELQKKLESLFKDNFDL